MKNKDFRQTAGTFKYDDFDIVFKNKSGKELECGSLEIDFDEKRIIIKQKEG